jgi:hypothetical protein
VPAGTLLVPYFRVEATVDAATGNLSNMTVDTLCAITNVSATGLIAHVTVWNKYSKPVFDFNIPMSGYDVATWKMSGLVNGQLNVNPLTQDPAKVTNDLCGIRLKANPVVFTPTTGFGKTVYIRFVHPDYTGTIDLNADYARSISIYATPNAFGSGSFRPRVWDSLDESGDVSSFTTSAGLNIIDPVSNPVCDIGNVTPKPAGPATTLTGYVTIDVVNYCTNWFPDQKEFYEKDAIATVGWLPAGYTPNALMGDVFYLDTKAAAGNISGDAMVHAEFDDRLNFSTRGSLDNLPPKTFYARYVEFLDLSDPPAYTERILSTGYNGGAPLRYRFGGDGREPLAEHYGFRYLNAAPAAQTWMVAWRSSITRDPEDDSLDQYNLCKWWQFAGPKAYGFWDNPHKLIVSTYDEDENLFAATGAGCPSGDPECRNNPNDLYIFLESQRIALAGNREINPTPFQFGWIDVRLYTGAVNNYYNMGYIGVQHTGVGQFVSVGHSATVLDGGFLCEPVVNFTNSNYLGAMLTPYENAHQINP